MISTKRPMFVERHDFIVNAFARRFRALLERAWKERLWLVLGAESYSGKSRTIGDLVGLSGGMKFSSAETYVPIAAAQVPGPRATEGALGQAIAGAFGVVPRMTWDRLRTWLVEEAFRLGLELLLLDDAHELSHAQLHYIKEFTDRLALPPFNRRIGVCLVAAANGHENPLVTLFTANTELTWRQFRNRLDPEKPFCIVLGHTEEELAEILMGYEMLYTPQLPDLNLVDWSESIHQWLIHPTLDTPGLRRATMGNIKAFVTLALRAVHAEGKTNIDEQIITRIGNTLTIHRNDIREIDGEPDDGWAAQVVVA